jgi:hypothetical protein
MGNDQSDLHLLLDEGGTPMCIIVISARGIHNFFTGFIFLDCHLFSYFLNR